MVGDTTSSTTTATIHIYSKTCDSAGASELLHDRDGRELARSSLPTGTGTQSIIYYASLCAVMDDGSRL